LHRSQKPLAIVERDANLRGHAVRRIGQHVYIDRIFAKDRG
jgi:hypothetical protein